MNCAEKTYSTSLGRSVGGEVVGDADAAEGRIDEDAGEQSADDAADAVDAEAVERIVIAELGLEPDHGPQADEAGGDADQDRALRVLPSRKPG